MGRIRESAPYRGNLYQRHNDKPQDALRGKQAHFFYDTIKFFYCVASGYNKIYSAY